MITSVDHNFVSKNEYQQQIRSFMVPKKNRKFINDNNYVSAVFLDLLKVFDSISHDILIANLQHELNFSDQSNSFDDD